MATDHQFVDVRLELELLASGLVAIAGDRRCEKKGGRDDGEAHESHLLEGRQPSAREGAPKAGSAGSAAVRQLIAQPRAL